MEKSGVEMYLERLEELDVEGAGARLPKKEMRRIVFACLSRCEGEKISRPEDATAIIRWAVSARRAVGVLRFMKTVSPDAMCVPGQKPEFSLSMRWDKHRREPEIRINDTQEVNEMIAKLDLPVDDKPKGRRQWIKVADLCATEEAASAPEREQRRKDRKERRKKERENGFSKDGVTIDDPAGKWLAFLSGAPDATEPPPLTDTQYEIMSRCMRNHGALVVVRDDSGRPKLHDAKTGLPARLKFDAMEKP